MLIRSRKELLLILAVCISIAAAGCAAEDHRQPGAASGHSDTNQPVMLGPILLGYGIQDLPDNPSVEQQIAAGEKQIEFVRSGDSTLDSNRELLDYFGGIERRLVDASVCKPPYPILVHISSAPYVNAVALPGGHMLVFDRIFDRVWNESELVAILSHETAHECRDDFLKFWHDYKTDALVYGSHGVLEQSQEMESAADKLGAQMMYAAGWDPHGMVVVLNRLKSMGVMARHGAPTFYSTHPRDYARISEVTALIDGLPSKPDLVRDSARFQEMKRKY